MTLRGALQLTRALLMATCCLMGSCRKLDICGSESLPCELGNGAGAGGAGRPEPAADPGGSTAASGAAGTAEVEAAGAAGASGAAGDAACVAPFAECDDSSLTVCETDTSRSPFHCGSCGHVCAGVCVENQCHPFTVVTGGAYDPSSSIAINKSHAFFAARPRLGSTRMDVLRLDRESGTVDVLVAQAFRDVEQLLFVGLRLYLLADSAVWSVDSRGANLREEEFDADQLTTFRSELYFTETESVYRWNDVSAVPELIVRTSPGSAILAGDAELLAIGSNDEIDEQRTYALYERHSAESGSALLDTGLGRLETLVVVNGDTFWLIEPGEQLSLQLRSAASEAPIELGPASELEGIAIVDGWVVVAEARRQRHYLRLIPLATPDEARELETAGALRGLQGWENQLWFYDTRQLALVWTSPLSLYQLAR